MLLDFMGRPAPTRKREVRVSDPKIAKFAAFADDVFRKLDLTVVCVHCGGTPQMGNSMTDTHWKMECVCSVRVLTNPDARGMH